MEKHAKRRGVVEVELCWIARRGFKDGWDGMGWRGVQRCRRESSLKKQERALLKLVGILAPRLTHR